ncbi:hypothetical protein WI95_26130 [Burkholderia contaminans]|nr:hypothetical protein WI95_26130 [Burkholderia contaminans]
MSIERDFTPLNDEVRIAFGDQANLVAFDRASAGITLAGNMDTINFEVRCATHDLPAVVGCVAYSNYITHRS